MFKENTIIPILALAALVALIYWRIREPAPAQQSDAAVTNLTVNQPFMFSPPVANIIPNMANSMLGESLPTNDPYYDPAKLCGC